MIPYPCKHGVTRFCRLCEDDSPSMKVISTAELDALNKCVDALKFYTNVGNWQSDRADYGSTTVPVPGTAPIDQDGGAFATQALDNLEAARSRVALKSTFTPYSQHVGDIPGDAEVDALLAEANKVLSTMNGVSSCHDAAEKFVRMTGKGKVVRGYFHPSFEHSWVEMGRYILDIYPVGGCRPHLIATFAAYKGPYSRE